MPAWRKLRAQLFSRQQHLLFRMDTGNLAAPGSGDSGSGTAREPRQDDAADDDHALELVVVSSETPSPRQGSARAALLTMARENRAYIADVDRGLATGLLILCDGKPVHYGFVFHRNRTMCLLGLPRGAALLAHAFTDPKERGKGHQTRSVQARAQVAADRGHKVVFSETSPDNIPSQRGLTKAGMELLGPITVIRILRLFVFRPVRPPGFARFEFCI